jgi:hypothetical protein
MRYRTNLYYITLRLGPAAVVQLVVPGQRAPEVNPAIRVRLPSFRQRAITYC